MLASTALLSLLVIVAVVVSPPGVLGFVARSPLPIRTFNNHQNNVIRHAKKSQKRQAGKGFAKQAPAPPPAPKQPESPMDVAASPSTQQQKQQPSSSSSSSSSFLQSVESGGSDSIPVVEQVPTTTKKDTTDKEELSPQERAKKLLRDQYGLRTTEEQRMEDQIQEQKKKFQQLKQKALDDSDNDFDIVAMLPAPLLKGIDTFLKLGVGICTLLFVTAGLGITAEAWSKTSGNPLPADIDNFIVNVVEPNFTPGLLVLLGFSVSLGAFAALQLGSASSLYKEE